MIALLLLVCAQAAAPKVDQKQVDAAIGKGVEFLKSAGSPGAFADKGHAIANSDELILYTFLHAGVAPTDPKFQEMGKKDEAHWYYYYLYALERVGVLYGTEKVGRREWYAEGAAVLLKNQRADGSWHIKSKYAQTEVWDTCFAILFLKRATRPLVPVASVPAGGKD